MTPTSNTLIRSGLKIIGGALVMKGWLDADNLDSFISIMEMGLGGAASAVGLAWSLWAKRPQSKEAAKIAVAVQQVTPEPLGRK